MAAVRVVTTVMNAVLGNVVETMVTRSASNVAKARGIVVDITMTVARAVVVATGTDARNASIKTPHEVLQPSSSHG